LQNTVERAEKALVRVWQMLKFCYTESNCFEPRKNDEKISEGASESHSRSSSRWKQLYENQVHTVTPKTWFYKWRASYLFYKSTAYLKGCWSVDNYSKIYYQFL